MKRLRRLAIIFTTTITLASTALYFNQEKIIFFPSTLPDNYSFDLTEPDSEMFINLKNGARINLLKLHPKKTSQSNSPGTIIYFHGNAGSLKGWTRTARQLSEKTGWNIWIMDYPGFGKSTGKLPKNETILNEMASTIFDHFKEENPNSSVIIFGRSLGTGIASKLALNRNVTALILETPYTSLAKLGHEIYPILPEWFSRFDLNNEKNLLELTKPKLIIHGKLDPVIPYHHGKLLGNAPQSVFISLDKGGHNNLSSFDKYWDELIDFVRKQE